MPGLIGVGTDLTKTPSAIVGAPDTANAKSYGYDPTLGTVNSGTDTVSGQMDTLLNKDSPYITKARADAARVANSRGLLNSTMGAQAGESAAIAAAMPIAQQDASTYSQQRLTNQGASNTADQFGANAANTASQFNANANNAITSQGYGAQLQTGLIGTQGAETRATQAAAGDIASRQIGEQGEQTRLTAAQTAAAQTELQTLQGSQAEALQTKQIASQENLQANLIASQKALQDSQNSTTLTVAEKNAAQSKYNAELAANTQTQMQGIDNAFKTAMQTADAANKVQLAQIDATTKTELANIQSTYQQVLQTSTSATSMFTTGMSNIQRILEDSNTPAASKATLVNGQIDWMRQGINVIGNITHVNLSNLLDFSTFQPV